MLNFNRFIEESIKASQGKRATTGSFNSKNNMDIPIQDNIDESNGGESSNEGSIKQNTEETEIRTKEPQEKSCGEDILSLEFNETSLTQAFIYSEIFGKPKSLRRGR